MKRDDSKVHRFGMMSIGTFLAVGILLKCLYPGEVVESIRSAISWAVGVDSFSLSLLVSVLMMVGEVIASLVLILWGARGAYSPVFLRIAGLAIIGVGAVFYASGGSCPCLPGIPVPRSIEVYTGLTRSLLVGLLAFVLSGDGLGGVLEKIALILLVSVISALILLPVFLSKETEDWIQRMNVWDGDNPGAQIKIGSLLSDNDRVLLMYASPSCASCWFYMSDLEQKLALNQVTSPFVVVVDNLESERQFLQRLRIRSVFWTHTGLEIQRRFWVRSMPFFLVIENGNPLRIKEVSGHEATLFEIFRRYN